MPNESPKKCRIFYVVNTLIWPTVAVIGTLIRELKEYRIVCVLFYFAIFDFKATCYFVCQNAYKAKHVPVTTPWLDTFWTCALVNK